MCSTHHTKKEGLPFKCRECEAEKNDRNLLITRAFNELIGKYAAWLILFPFVYSCWSIIFEFTTSLIEIGNPTGLFFLKLFLSIIFTILVRVVLINIRYEKVKDSSDLSKNTYQKPNDCICEWNLPTRNQDKPF